NVTRPAQPESCGSDYVIERACLGSNVEVSMTGFYVLVVRSTVQNHVALHARISACGVVGDLIRVQHVIAIVDLRLSTQFVDRAVSFLLYRANGHLFLGQARRRSRRRSGNRLGGRGLAGYYRSSEKEMTKRKGRDNDSVAEDHLQEHVRSAGRRQREPRLTLACGWDGS